MFGYLLFFPLFFMDFKHVPIATSRGNPFFASVIQSEYLFFVRTRTDSCQLTGLAITFINDNNTGTA
jgi:hypothetical protein